MEKYLHRYAEPEIAVLDDLINERITQWHWANVLVIPACNENSDFLRPAPPCDGRGLLILVVNQSESATHKVSSNNRALVAAVHARFELQWQSGSGYPDFGLSLFADTHGPRDLLLVDRFSEGRQLPQKGGVGHARKIGADLAAYLIQRQCIRSNWIHCSDADVHLPESYFTCSESMQNPMQENASQYAALTYPFRHRDDGDGTENTAVNLATQLYELSLRYYLAGLKYARSPYAFHTIGSTMAVDAVHYAKVRGFPKREAGEDFYLLNKLAKVGSVFELAEDPACQPLRIRSRRSDRVPFGTGAAVNKITALTDPPRDFRFYHPAVFELLQIYLKSLPAIWETRSNNPATCILPDSPDDSDQHDKLQALLAGLTTIGIQQALDHAFRQSRDLKQFTRQMHTWFDAFRTLKLIHILRDHHLPSVNYAELAAQEIFCDLLTQEPDLLACKERLDQKLSGLEAVAFKEP